LQHYNIAVSCIEFEAIFVFKADLALIDRLFADRFKSQ
jgi:hypothetical protein